jgi:hypothetical protein
MRSTIKQHGGKCGIAREAKHRRYPIICSGSGSSTIRVRDPANENNQYVDPKKNSAVVYQTIGRHNSDFSASRA